MQEFPFYRLATMGWANPLLRQTVTLLRPEPPAEILVDLSRIEFIDSFGITYLAACFENCRGSSKVRVRPPARQAVNNYLQDAGLYEAIGLGEHFRPRIPKEDRVDLKHVKGFEPLFVDSLLNFLESLQPFAPGLKESMRMSLLELVQNFAEHSGSVSGAWVSGQRYKSRITLCVIDLGRGIPALLRTVGKYRRYRDSHLVELATEEGVSSVTESSRGLGLSTIRRFVRVNRGMLTIVAGRGRVRFRADRRPIRDELDEPFPGTAVFLSLVPTSRGLYVL